MDASPASRTERTGALLALARSEAGPDGFLPFDRWMDLALYADGVGYYTGPRTPFGTTGDFYTAPQVHPLFAASFAERIRAVRSRLGPDRPFTLVELGPGEGTLAAGIVSALGAAWTSRGPTRVVLVERSAPLRAKALSRVRQAADPDTVVVSSVEGVSALGPFEGVVVANEFLDAQPARRLRWKGGEWRELGVRVTAEGVRAAEGPLGTPVSGPQLPTSVPEGTVVEFSPAGEGVLREVADHLVAGTWLIDDYGMEESELLLAHPEGTLATVRGHRTGPDPLAEPGEADLSTFVNWTRVRTAARAAGLDVVADTSQAEALGRWGFSGLLERAIHGAGTSEAEVRLRLSAKNLLFGFERFRVVELAPARLADRFRSTT
ncbi:MAG: SAM-dependent methyltransferase [Thermoplasmata archaeon]|nr:SAM-dependent methyltransferase [Thermoplasmata archaeon]